MEIPKLNLKLNEKNYTISNYVVPSLDLIDKWLLIKERQEDLALGISKQTDGTKEYYQYIDKSYRENLNLIIDYIKIMIDYSKIKDADLIENIQSDCNSDFWKSQDIIHLTEVQESFRLHIKL